MLLKERTVVIYFILKEILFYIYLEYICIYYIKDLTKEEDDAMQNLHNLTNKISIEGDGLGQLCLNSH